MNGSKLPLVSIIVNCYNSDLYLKETLESIIDQSYTNWEVIFWDNQSTDNSALYLKSYNEPRFKYHYAPEFTSLSTARNLAVKKAEGEFIAFLDCDDLWTKDKLALQMPYFDDKDIGLVYSDFDLIMQSDSPGAVEMFNSFSRIVCNAHKKKNIYFRLLRSNFIIFSTIVIRKQVFDTTGGFTNEFKHNEDYEILLKASVSSDAVCVKEHTTKYRIHGGNNSYQNKMVAYEEIRAIFNSLPNSQKLRQAININEARYLIAKINHGERGLIPGFFSKKGLITGLTGLMKRKFNTMLYNRKQLR